MSELERITARRNELDVLAEVHDLSTAIAAGRGHRNWDEPRAAQQDLLVAERETAHVPGDEYAVELDLGMLWRAGAPLPHLLVDGLKAYVMFYLPSPDPNWDGTWVRIVDPASPQEVPLGVVEFHHVHSIKLGGPNDEAINGHPLSGKGLRPYAAHRVINSRWISAEKQINSVHPSTAADGTTG